MTENATYCDKHVSSRKCIFFVVNWANYMEAGARQIALEAVRHAHVHDADFYYQLVKWVSRLEAEASVDHAGMERANAREQHAISHLWQVRGEVEDAGASV